MNLHGLASGLVSAVNPLMPVSLLISTGQTTAADGTRTPSYATPGQFTGSIVGNVLTVTSVASGKLLIGQRIDGANNDVLPGTLITRFGSGSGGAGTYEVSRGQDVASEAMTTSLIVSAQIQPVTWRDLQQMEALNIEGVRWKVYLHGQVDGVVRLERKGGDIVVVPAGRHAGTWLVAQVLEQWPDWVCAAITLQNVPVAPPSTSGPSLDFSDPANSQYEPVLPGV